MRPGSLVCVAVARPVPDAPAGAGSRPVLGPEPGVAGAKYAMSRLDLCSDRVRLPLVGLTDGTRSAIDAAMSQTEPSSL